MSGTPKHQELKATSLPKTLAERKKLEKRIRNGIAILAQVSDGKNGLLLFKRLEADLQKLQQEETCENTFERLQEYR